MDSIELLARFGYQPNKDKLCGPSDVSSRVRAGIISGDVSGIRDELYKFPIIRSYCESIGAARGVEWDNDDVAEAYIIGNELLDDFPRSGFLRLVKKLAVVRNWDKGVDRYISRRIPSKAVPHHSLDVLFMNGLGGAVTEEDLGRINKCLVIWGKVERVDDNRLFVYYPFLGYDEGFKWKGLKKKPILYDSEMVPNVSVGDFVAMHWNFAFMKLTEKQCDAIKKYTERNMDAVNSVYK